MKSNLYLLVTKDKDKFKIGKSDNIYERLKTLENNMKTEFSLKNSYYIKCDVKLVHKMEHLFHLLFDAYKVENMPVVDGYTEWFKYECFRNVLNTLTAIEQNTKEIEIHKGILLNTVENQKRTKIKKRRQKYTKVRREDIQFANKQMNKAIHLMKKESQTETELEIIDKAFDDWLFINFYKYNV